jgi:hypothetical protein
MWDFGYGFSNKQVVSSAPKICVGNPPVYTKQDCTRAQLPNSPNWLLFQIIKSLLY